ncbi:MAG: hypothetical protein ABIZ50_05875, partial [Solirubrobacterales bacterium]
ERDELFSGWRLFFECLSEHEPVVLVFEDMQWAEEGLLDFIEELLSWSAEHPILVCTLARPELADRRSDWPVCVPAGTRLQLHPLRDDCITELLRSVVGGVPDRALQRIVAQSEGIPLYAVETIRTLADRGVLAQGPDGLSLLADLGDLTVPASLSSLLAARLDALDPDEREVVKSMAIFGGSFTRTTAAALAEVPEARLDEVLASLLRKEVLLIRSDPLSPDRGQYTFAQGILRTVAYEMIAKRERCPRHLAAAEHLRQAFPNDGEEVAEMIATHLLDAYRSTVVSDDELRGRTVLALRRAAQHSAKVGAPDAAERMLRRAIQISDGEPERTDLTVEAGRMAELGGRHDAALEHYETAEEAHRAAGRDEAAERLSGPISLALGRLGRHEESIARLRRATEHLEPGRLDADGAGLLCELGRSLLFAGHSEEAGEVIERALDAAEALELPVLTCRLLNFKGARAVNLGRFEEARALYDGAIAVGDQYRLPARASAQGNAADLRVKRDMPDAVEQCEAAVAVGRQVGDRSVESIGIGNLMMAKILLGDWHEVERIGEDALQAGDSDRPDAEDIHFYLGLLAVRRGNIDAARTRLARVESWEGGDDIEARQLHLGLTGLIALGEGESESAFDLLGRSARMGIDAQGPSSDGARLAWPDAAAAALALGRIDEAEALVSLLTEQPLGLVPPLLRAELAHAKALVAAERNPGSGGDEEEGVEAQFRLAIAGHADLGYPYWRARAQTKFAGWLEDNGRADEAAELRDEGATCLARLGVVTPERADSRDLAAGRPQPA